MPLIYGMSVLVEYYTSLANRIGHGDNTYPTNKYKDAQYDSNDKGTWSCLHMLEQRIRKSC